MKLSKEEEQRFKKRFLEDVNSAIAKEKTMVILIMLSCFFCMISKDVFSLRLHSIAVSALALTAMIFSRIWRDQLEDAISFIDHIMSQVKVIKDKVDEGKTE